MRTKNDIRKFEQTEIKVKIEIIENKKQLKSELNQQEYISEIIENNSGFIISLNNQDCYRYLFLILSKCRVLKIMEQELSLEDLFGKFYK
ncbi:MAG: hypothetical protein ACTSRI_21480 [Promethearchaeota archaeon]